MSRLTGLLGLGLILVGAWAFSTRRTSIRPRVVLWGLGLQITLALLVLRTGFGRVFELIGAGVTRMLDFAQAGSEFVFGPLASATGPAGVVFAFRVLPIIIFVASFFLVVPAERVMGALRMSWRSSSTVIESKRSATRPTPFTLPERVASMTVPSSSAPGSSALNPSIITASDSVALTGLSTWLKAEPTVVSRRTLRTEPDGIVTSRHVGFAGSAGAAD